MSKVSDGLKEPIDNATKQLTEKCIENISAVVNALILLSRPNLLPAEELDAKLGQLLPSHLIEIVKDQSKLLPPDPYMEELKKLSEKMDALSAKLDDPAAAVLKK